MTHERKKLGSHGEDLAVEFLKRQGYRILQRNFKLKFGEIDIVAQEGDTVCFIEVRTKTGDELGTPFESITPFKQRKLSRLALAYLKNQYKSVEVRARFDVVAVFSEDGKEEKVEIIKNAFEVYSY